MFTVGAAALLLGVLLIYGGVKGLSIQRLLIGDNQTKAAPTQLNTTAGSAA